MARNIAITAGTGTTTAADEVTISATSVKVQEVKFAIGKVGTFVGDASGRLVDATSDEAALYTDNRPKTARIQVASAGITTSVTAYTSGDQVGTVFSFVSAARAAGGTGRIRGATLVDKAKVLGACELWLFDRAVTAAADNAAQDFSDADALFFQTALAFPTPTQSANNYFSEATLAVPKPYVCNSTGLSGHLVTRTGNAVFGAATDVVITLHVELD